ncbi:TPA: putative DNA-binding domain-containing protein [Legionella pneumophila]|nr:putative DNA-binding domain-containing protein [Legionella pneumophila]
MKLNDLQTLLQNSILTSEPLIHPHLQAPPKGSVSDRVAIYADGFYGRLEEVLANDYEVLASVVGKDKFSELCRAYINKYPSCSDSLNFFGQNLSQFLTETLPYNKKTYIAEIAAFEWAEYQSVVSGDKDLLTESDLHALPVDQWPELKFELHPSCQILTFYWNSLSLIEALRRNKSAPKPKLLKRPQAVLVWRHQLEIRYTQLNSLELTMLHAIKRQESFIEICEVLRKEVADEEVATYIVKELHTWLKAKLFVIAR